MSILSDQLALAEVIGGGIGNAATIFSERKKERERFRKFKDFMESQGHPITGEYDTMDDYVINSDMQSGVRNWMLGTVVGQVQEQRVGQNKKAMEMARALVSDVPSEMKKHGIDPSAPSVQSFLHDFRQRKKEFEEENQTQGPSTGPEGRSALRQLTNAWAKRGAEAFVLQNRMTPKKLQAVLANYEAGSGLFDRLPLNLQEVNLAASKAMDQYKKQDKELTRRDVLRMHNAEANQFALKWAAMEHAGYEPEYIQASLERQKSRLDILADQFDMLGDLEDESGFPKTAPLTVRDPDSPTGYAKAALVEGKPVAIPGTVAPDPNRASAEVTTNVYPPNEDKGLEEAAKLGAKEVSEANAQMKQLETSQALLSAMERITDSVGRGGSLAGKVTEMQSLLASFGVESEGLDERQMFERLTNALALGFRSPEGPLGGLTGNTSDRDIAFLLTLPPAITNTPRGRRMAIDTWKKVFARNRLYAKEIDKWYRSEATLEDGSKKPKYTTLGWAEHWEQIRNQEDVFGEDERKSIQKEIDKSASERKAELEKQYPDEDERQIYIRMLDEGW